MRANLQRAALILLFLSSRAWAADAGFVIQISVDGLRGDLLAAALAGHSSGDLRNFRRFVDEGACTFNARPDFTSTHTLPNHTCMLTGRPVSKPAKQPRTLAHGYVSNVDPPLDETLHQHHGSTEVAYIPSVFDVVHDAGLSTAFYASKQKFILFDRSYDAVHGAPDAVPPDDGTDKIDRYVSSWTGSPANASSMQAVFLADMRSHPYNYCFVHYLDPDAAGHDLGWGSPAWQEALRRVDRDLGEVLRLVETEPRLAGHTTVLLTADHGGLGTSHSDPKLRANYTIPFLAWGAGVARGADLYRLNPTTRADPGSRRPDYDTTPPPIRNGDAGNLDLMLLGLGPIPGSTIDARQDLVLRAGSTGARAAVAEAIRAANTPRDALSSTPSGKAADTGASNPIAGEPSMSEKHTEIATLAGGCFWCLEAVFSELRGVDSVQSGYTGGSVQNPTYEQVCTGRTGHAEAVQVVFDPAVISFHELLEVFFTIHDPTTLNRQGADVGTQYRSALFYHTPEQKAGAEQVIAELDSAKLWDAPIVTERTAFTVFYPAESYHRDYFERNPEQPYCRLVIAPKVAKARSKFLAKLKK